MEKRRNETKGYGKGRGGGVESEDMKEMIPPFNSTGFPLVILKYILKKWDVNMRTGFVWFSIQSSGGLL
jgi:hypothetical protein